MAQGGNSKEQEIKNQKLYDACLKEDVQLIKQLIGEGADPEYIEEKSASFPILFELMYKNKIKAAEAIVKETIAKYGKDKDIINKVIDRIYNYF